MSKPLRNALTAIRNDCQRVLDGDDFSGMSDNELFGAFVSTVDSALQAPPRPLFVVVRMCHVYDDGDEAWTEGEGSPVVCLSRGYFESRKAAQKDADVLNLKYNKNHDDQDPYEVRTFRHNRKA